MSRPIRETINCPQCAKPQPFTRWSSLNVTLNPKEKPRLLDGSLTRFVCESCGHSAKVVYPLLYHDMQRSVMIWLLPRDPSGGSGEAPEESPPGMSSKLGSKYRFRSVVSQNQLIEKILIFDADLDDRVIELAKLLVESKLPDEQRAANAELFFNGVEGAGESANMNFAVLSAAGQGGMGVSRDAMCRTLSAQFAASLESQPTGPWPRVDRDWAMERMTENATRSQKPAAPPHRSPAPSPAAKKSNRWWPFGR